MPPLLMPPRLLLLLLLLLLQVPWRAPDLPHAPLGGAVQAQRQTNKPRLLRQGELKPLTCVNPKRKKAVGVNIGVWQAHKPRLF
jgi:hypothetical protein